MKQTTLYFSLIFLLLGCGKRLIKEPNKTICYEELPAQVKKQIELYQLPKIAFREDGDTVKIFGGNEEFICLDEVWYSNYYTDNSGPFIDRFNFRINFTKFFIGYGESRKIGPPYVLLNKKLYYLSFVIIDSTSVHEGTYGVFDLSERLTY